MAKNWGKYALLMAKNDARCAHGDEVEGSFESAYAQEVCLI